MRFPKKSHLVTLERIDNTTVCMRNIYTGDVWDISIDIARFLMKLNGKRDPYKIDSVFSKCEVDDLMEFFAEENCLYSGKRLRKEGLGSICFTLYIPKIKRIHRVIAKIYNLILMVLFVPAIFISINAFAQAEFELTGDMLSLIIGILIGNILGIVLHEVSHAASILAFGGKVMEFGLMLYFFMPGAYVLEDGERIKNPIKKAQISAAGPEANFLLSGLFLFLLRFECLDAEALAVAASLNFILAFSNLAFIGISDGMAIISQLLGLEDLDKMKILIFSNKAKKALLRENGINGLAVILAAYLLAFFQICMWCFTIFIVCFWIFV